MLGAGFVLLLIGWAASTVRHSPPGLWVRSRHVATIHLEVVAAHATARVDAVLPFVVTTDVTVTRPRTFANLADVENPAENLVGIAQSASRGAITAKKLNERRSCGTVKSPRPFRASS